MKYLFIYSYNTGKLLAKKALPKAQGRSVSYEVETMGGIDYLVVRDYRTGIILHKFRKTGTKWDCSIEYEVKYDYWEE